MSNGWVASRSLWLTAALAVAISLPQGASAEEAPAEAEEEPVHAEGSEPSAHDSGEAEAHGHEDGDHAFHKNHLALFLGATTPLQQRSHTSFTLGLDYERLFVPVVGLYTAGEFTFGSHEREGLLAAGLVVRPIRPAVTVDFVGETETNLVWGLFVGFGF